MDGHKIIEDFKIIKKEDAEFSQRCLRIANEIDAKQLTIVQLVEQLGGLLVDALPSNRELGTWILTGVLKELPLNCLDKEQLVFICSFYIDRLKDHHQVIPAVLSGIYALAFFEKFPEGVAVQFLSVLFKHVSCQQQQQKDREQIYKIFELFLLTHKTELQQMGFEFIYGIITAVDGERDPKNLVFLFHWFPTFLKTMKLEHLTEEAFEVIACYFPVDFKAPPQDPNTTTREALSQALAPCLCAIPEFAEFCIPLALQKLDSSLEIAKIDSLSLLKIGCDTFEPASYAQHITEIWSQIQKELFNNPNQTIENACLTTLRAVVHKISSEPILETTLKDISDTVKRNLMPDSKLFAPSSKLLIAVSEASIKSSDFITKDIAPIYINSYDITQNLAQRQLILRELVKLFNGYMKLHQTVEFQDLEKVQVLCLKAAVDNMDPTLKITGLESLVVLSKNLSQQCRLAFYEQLRYDLITFQDQKVRVALLQALVHFARGYPEEIKKNVVDSIKIQDLAALKLYLSALREIGLEKYFTEGIIDIILSYLKRDLDTAQVVLNSGKKFLQRHMYQMEIIDLLVRKNVIGNVVNLVIAKGEAISDEALTSAGIIIKTNLAILPSEQQAIILGSHFNRIRQCKHMKSHIVLLDGILCTLRRNVAVDYRILEDVLTFVIEGDALVRKVAVLLFANLINKCPDEEYLCNFLSDFDRNYSSNYDIFVMLCAWITKALSMRNFPVYNTWLGKLVEFLKQDTSIAPYFRILLDDQHDSLSLASHCNATILYRQKLFSLAAHKLSGTYKPEFEGYLYAIGYILEFAPKTVVLIHFKEISQLVLLALEKTAEPEILKIILDIILDFTINKETCIQDNLANFVTRLCSLSTFEKSMHVRILALECLQQFALNFPVYTLLPMKQDVLSVLGIRLDDRKRMVRRKAVDARTSWFLMDAPQ